MCESYEFCCWESLLGPPCWLNSLYIGLSTWKLRLLELLWGVYDSVRDCVEVFQVCCIVGDKGKNAVFCGFERESVWEVVRLSMCYVYTAMQFFSNWGFTARRGTKSTHGLYLASRISGEENNSLATYTTYIIPCPDIHNIYTHTYHHSNPQPHENPPLIQLAEDSLVDPNGEVACEYTS